MSDFRNMYITPSEETKYIGDSVYKLFNKLEYGETEIRVFEIYNNGDTFESNYIDFETYQEAKTFFDNIKEQREVVKIAFGG